MKDLWQRSFPLVVKARDIRRKKDLMEFCAQVLS